MHGMNMKLKFGDVKQVAYQPEVAVQVAVRRV
jgi:hypothetical protein